MWNHIRPALLEACCLSLILVMTVSNLGSASALLPPTIETTLSGSNLIFDNVLHVPSVSIDIQQTAILRANFTTQFESNSSDASIDWAFFTPDKCNFTLHVARFEIFGFLTSWTAPAHRSYFVPGVDYSYGNETGKLLPADDRQGITYHFALGEPIRAMQTAYSRYYPDNLTIRKDSVPVIIDGLVDLSTNCGVQKNGYTYFADLKVSNQLQAATEVELSVPADATITFFSSNLVRLRPNVFWLPLTDSLQRFYVQYDLTPWYLLSPTRDFIVGSITGFLISFLAWGVGSIRRWKRAREERRRRERLDLYLH